MLGGARIWNIHNIDKGILLGNKTNNNNDDENNNTSDNECERVSYFHTSFGYLDGASNTYGVLTHWDRDKMAANFLTTISNA